MRLLSPPPQQVAESMGTAAAAAIHERVAGTLSGSVVPGVERVTQELMRGVNDTFTKGTSQCEYGSTSVCQYELYNTAC